MVKVPSRSRPGVFYEVEGDTCTCERQLYKPGEECSHIKRAKAMGKLTPNEYLVSVSGKTAVPSPLELDAEVQFRGAGQVVKVETLNRQDGSYDTVFVIKPYSIEIYERGI